MRPEKRPWLHCGSFIDTIPAGQAQGHSSWILDIHTRENADKRQINSSQRRLACAFLKDARHWIFFIIEWLVFNSNKALMWNIDYALPRDNHSNVVDFFGPFRRRSWTFNSMLSERLLLRKIWYLMPCNCLHQTPATADRSKPVPLDRHSQSLPLRIYHPFSMDFVLSWQRHEASMLNHWVSFSRYNQVAMPC